MPFASNAAWSSATLAVFASTFRVAAAGDAAAVTGELWAAAAASEACVAVAGDAWAVTGEAWATVALVAVLPDTLPDAADEVAGADGVVPLSVEEAVQPARSITPARIATGGSRYR